MKFLYVLTGLILLTFSVSSQISRSDTTCIPDEKLRLALKKIEQGKLDAAELQMTRMHLDLANRSMDMKDSVISSQWVLISSFKSSVENYRSQLVMQKARTDIANFNMDALEKQLKRQKIKTWFVGAAGVLGSVGIAYLLVR